MKRKTSPDGFLIRYLLGELAEEEQVQLEEQFFADEEIYQQLLAVEDELKYEYAQGGLTPQRRQSFEKRFLATDADRQKVALAGAILARANEIHADRAAFHPRPAPWWQSLANLLTLPSPGLRLAFNCAALLVLAGGVWFGYQTVHLRSQLAGLEAERASIEQKARQLAAAGQAQQEQLNQRLAQERDRLGQLEKELATRQPSSNVLSFILIPGLVRDVDGPKRLVVPADSGLAHFQLQPRSKMDSKSYRVELQTLDGDQLWSQNVPQPACDIPARLLPPGDYVIVLKGTTPAGEAEDAGEFYFTVVRR
jgi:hypothetical protein